MAILPPRLDDRAFDDLRAELERVGDTRERVLVEVSLPGVERLTVAHTERGDAVVP